MPQSDVLHLKYRPKTFAEVIGQPVIIRQLAKVINDQASQAFLLCGPSGVGKTTLARIAAAQLGCRDADVYEMDAATNTGIDTIRQLQDNIQYKPFGGSDHRAVIVDECHAMTSQAWKSLLKSIEEPPPHVTWFFCTTHASKVPPTIKTRCTTFTLKLLSFEALNKLVNLVVKKEQINISEGIRDLIVREAKGSPRQALVNLAACIGTKTTKEAAEVLRTALESDAIVQLCRLLDNGGSWQRAMTLINMLEGENPESIRIIITNWMASCLKSAKTEEKAKHYLAKLECFEQPYTQSDNHAPLYLSIGRVLYHE